MSKIVSFALIIIACFKTSVLYFVKLIEKAIMSLEKKG